jgi:translation elongation factor EF-1alpha
MKRVPSTWLSSVCFVSIHHFNPIGHVDAGKSTLMGHLLFLLGEVDERIMKKYERESQKIGKGSFMYAWVLDESEQERERYSHSSLSFLL